MLKPAKDAFYSYGRGLLRVPHEVQFRIMRLFSAPDDQFLDVGANHGQTIESILLFRPNARIISFEVNPLLARKLQARYAGQRNITVNAIGLGDAPGKVTLHTPVYNGFVYDGVASITREGATGWISSDTVYGFKPSKLVLQEVPCCIEALDSLELAPTFIKLNVGVATYGSLFGGRKTLACHEPVLTIAGYRDDPRIEALLQPMGYREYHFDKVTGGLRPGYDGDSNRTFLVTERRIGPLATVN